MLFRKVHPTSLIAAALFTAAIASIPAAAQAQAQALQRSPVAPRAEQVKAVVNEAYEKFKNDTGGKNADYWARPGRQFL